MKEFRSFAKDIAATGTSFPTLGEFQKQQVKREAKRKQTESVENALVELSA